MNRPESPANASLCSRRVLIVGGDGTIGSRLAEQLRGDGQTVLTTTRRGGGGAGESLLDLERPSGWQPPDNLTLAYLCAAVTSLAQCRRFPERSAQVNVAGTLEVARKLIERQVFVVFPSTNQVFDGQRPFAAPDLPPAPQTAYGRQKAEVERQLFLSAGACTVVRLAKVLPERFALFDQWARDLRAGRPIQAFSDLQIAPIPLAFAVDVLARTGQRRPAGIVHVSGDRDVRYADIARRLAARMGVSSDLVAEMPAAAAGYLEPVPRHTTLDNRRLESELGLSPPDVWETIDRVLEEAIGASDAGEEA